MVRCCRQHLTQLRIDHSHRLKIGLLALECAYPWRGLREEVWLQSLHRPSGRQWLLLRNGPSWRCRRYCGRLEATRDHCRLHCEGEAKVRALGDVQRRTA
jgi:hypothetical protein